MLYRTHSSCICGLWHDSWGVYPPTCYPPRRPFESKPGSTGYSPFSDDVMN